jgi:hypothetical protein
LSRTPGWLAIVAVVALACAMLITAIAQADAPSLTDRLVAAQHLPGVRSANEPAVDERELAELIASTSKGNRTLAALMLTMASTESGLRRRIADSQCKPLECDHGRSVGLWQSKRLERGADLATQPQEAARELMRVTKECHGLPFPLAAMRAYGSGGGCHAPIPRETERSKLFARVRSRL